MWNRLWHLLLLPWYTHTHKAFPRRAVTDMPAQRRHRLYTWLSYCYAEEDWAAPRAGEQWKDWPFSWTTINLLARALLLLYDALFSLMELTTKDTDCIVLAGIVPSWKIDCFLIRCTWHRFDWFKAAQWSKPLPFDGFVNGFSLRNFTSCSLPDCNIFQTFYCKSLFFF